MKIYAELMRNHKSQRIKSLWDNILAVEYSSDVLLGLQYDFMEYRKTSKEKKGEQVETWENEQERSHRIREAVQQSYIDAELGRPVVVECKVLKNRNGRKGSCFFDFFPKYNRYRENAGRSMGAEVADKTNPFADAAADERPLKPKDYIGRTFADKKGSIWKGVRAGNKVLMENQSTRCSTTLEKWLKDNNA